MVQLIFGGLNITNKFYLILPCVSRIWARLIRPWWFYSDSGKFLLLTHRVGQAWATLSGRIGSKIGLCGPVSVSYGHI